MANDDGPQADEQSKKGKAADFCKSVGLFLYNPETGAVLTRTGLSWLKILAFYITLYLFFAGYFGLMLRIFFCTVDNRHPKFTGSDSMLNKAPAMGVQPMPDIGQSMIHYNINDKASYRMFTDYLRAFLLEYDDTKQDSTPNMVPCGTDKAGRAAGDMDTVCQFKTNLFGPCNSKNEFGYPQGEPCAIVKLNKVFGWTPSTNISIELECVGENPADQDNLGGIVYYPTNSFPAYYYPYLTQDNYLSPLVMIQLKKPKLGVLIMIECHANDTNIPYSRQNRQGSVRFQVLIDY